MESSWPSGGIYTYYQPEALRSTDRQTTSPGMSNMYDEPGHRRASTMPHGSSFLPPPPPTAHAGAGNVGGMNLPPLSQTFYPSYPSTSTGHGSQSTPSNIHTLPHNVTYSPHMSMSAPSSGAYHYASTSPVNMTDGGPMGSRAPIHPTYNESPRIPGYSSSPGLHHHHFSPTSPTTNLMHGMNPSSASTSSSSFPSIARTPAHLPKGMKRRSTSASHSVGSWEDDRLIPTSTEMDTKELTEQPWGMPQEAYKALNPRDKKQVRNRIGARRFRAKRKDYVNNIEATLRERDEENAALKAKLDAANKEINEYRQRLGLPPKPDPPALGLNVGVGVSTGTAAGRGDDWDGKLEGGM
ncbi:hypothetical protein IAU60_006411 [Kwoniella sp. DSM 27419]